MNDDKSKDDAADKAPRPDIKSEERRADKQDAPNYGDREDGGRSIETSDLNSANDE